MAANKTRIIVFYRPASGVRVFWWFVVLGVAALVVWAFCGWLAWQAGGYGSLSKTSYGVGLGIITAWFIFCGVKIQRYPWNKIELSEKGIGQAQSQTKTVFIEWKEVGNIRANSLLSQITVKDGSGKKRIAIHYDYGRIQELLTLVFHETLKGYPLPEMPVKFGISLIPFELIVSAILTLGIVGIVWFVILQHQSHGDAEGLKVFLIPVLSIMGYVFGNRAVVLDQNAITLFGFIGHKSIKWEELQNFGWVMESSSNTSSKTFVVTLEDKKGERFIFRGWMGHQVEIFLTIKKMWNNRHRK